MKKTANSPSRGQILFLFVPFLLLLSMAWASAEPLPGNTQAQVDSLEAIQLKGPGIAPKDPAMTKVDQGLAVLFHEYQGHQQLKTFAPFQPSNPLVLVSNGYVTIDAAASGDPAVLEKDLVGLGMIQGAKAGVVVSGRIPVTAIDKVAALPSLQFMRLALATLSQGSVDSQGDASMRSDEARALFGVDGSGIAIGVLSDSYDCLGGASGDVASGDLPDNVLVLDDNICPDGTDEGRGMLQLVHDVAPGSRLMFHSAFGGQANFAQGILDLAAEGAKVIVDDVLYFAEPMFQDGVVAQAVESVVQQGVSYFSSAGNDSRNSYESSFNPSSLSISIDSQPAGEAHDFDSEAGVDIYQQISIPEGRSLLMAFQWDSPYYSISPASGGSNNNLDIFLVDGNKSLVLASSRELNVGGDPFEFIYFHNPAGSGQTEFNILITLLEGSAPGLMKYISYRSWVSIDEYATYSGTSSGHPNCLGAEAVGAAYYADTPAFGTSPPRKESFSSYGGVPILFDEWGERLPDPVMLKKPNIVAPDGGNTTFFGYDSDNDGYPNFFGTSAAAPHAAAVAALMLQADPTLAPGQVYGALESTAIDMDDPATQGFDQGFDYATGYGLIQADLAVGKVLPRICDIDVSPMSLDYGEVMFGDMKSLKVRIGNAGNGHCTVDTLTIAGNTDFYLAAANPTVPFAVEPGGAVEVAVNYSPSDQGDDGGHLYIGCNDGDENPVDVALRGKGFYPGADLSVAMTGSPSPVRLFQDETFFLEVVNLGPLQATDVILTDGLPENAELLWATSTQGYCFNRELGSGFFRWPILVPDRGSKLTCKLGDLQPGQSAKITIRTKVLHGKTVTNGASVAAGNPEDHNLANNSATVTTPVISPWKRW